MLAPFANQTSTQIDKWMVFNLFFQFNMQRICLQINKANHWNPCFNLLNTTSSGKDTYGSSNNELLGKENFIFLLQRQSGILFWFSQSTK